MARCFRCGKTISQPKCEQCGFEVKNGVRVLEKIKGSYEFPKVTAEASQPAEPSKSAAIQSVGANRASTASQPSSSTGTAGSTISSRATVSSAATPISRPAPAVTDRAVSRRRRERRKKILQYAAIAILVGLVAGAAVVGLVSWVRAFSANTWRAILGVVLGLAAAGGMIGTSVYNDQYGPQMGVGIAGTLINFVLIAAFPDTYRIVGALLAGGMGIGFAYVTYAAFEDFEEEHGVVCAGFMIANLLLIPWAWGVSLLGVIIYVVLVIICAIICAIYESSMSDNPVALQIITVAAAVVFYVVGYLCAPHFMHSLHRMPQIGHQHYAAETEVGADCYCGDTITFKTGTVDWLHELHGLVKGKIAEIEYNGTEHWKRCVCGLPYGYDVHEYADGKSCVVCAQIKGEEEYDGGINAYYDEACDVYVISSYTGTVKDIVIPGMLNGKPVVIGEGAFAGNTELEKVVLSEGVQEIGSTAFLECTGLTEIVIPDTVTKIGDFAFVECKSLKDIHIPETIAHLGEGAFGECYALESVELPYDWVISENGKEMISGLFRSNDTVKVCVVIPDGVAAIPAEAFSDNDRLNTVTIPDSVTMIGERAFFGCGGLDHLELPQGLTYIGDNAFAGCTALSGELGELVLPAGLLSIGMGAFGSCTDVIRVRIPDGITVIKDSTFGNCSSLVTVELPESVTCIEEYAFYHCEAMEEIVIPAGVTDIGYQAFAECTRLTRIVYRGTEDQWNTLNWSEKDDYRHLVVFEP